MPKEARQNPSLLRKRILSRSSIFSTRKNPQCIAAETPAGFSRTENRISTQPPLSRFGLVLPRVLEAARQNPSLLRKRILSRSSIFSTRKNPQCIAADTPAGFSRTENRISIQPPLSRFGLVLPRVPKRILILHPHFTLPGGAGRHALETGRELSQRGWDVHVGTISMNPTLIEGYESLSFHSIGGPLPSSLLYWIRLPLVLRNVRHLLQELAPDIVFSQVFPANWWGFFAKRHYKENFSHVWMCQEPSAFIHSDRWIRALPMSPAGITARVVNPLLKRIDCHLAHYVDYTFANSEFSRSLALKTYRYPPTKISVCYPGVDTTRFKTDPTCRKKMYQFVTCARLTKFKNTDIILRALATFTDPVFTLVIIGDGEEYDALQALAKTLQLTERVIFKGTVSDQELVGTLQSSIALIHAAEKEPFGLAPIEAMACGTPVIAIKGGGPAETILHLRTGYLCESATVEQLRSAIEWVVSVSGDATSMTSACTSRAQHFSWQNAADSLEQGFQRIVRSRQSPAGW
jgi:glycosyltransferase involved in cell wall biosynthesis